MANSSKKSGPCQDLGIDVLPLDGLECGTLKSNIRMPWVMSCADRNKLLRRWCIGSTGMSVKWQCDGFLRELVGSDLSDLFSSNEESQQETQF